MLYNARKNNTHKLSWTKNEIVCAFLFKDHSHWGVSSGFRANKPRWCWLYLLQVSTLWGRCMNAKGGPHNGGNNQALPQESVHSAINKPALWWYKPCFTGTGGKLSIHHHYTAGAERKICTGLDVTYSIYFLLIPGQTSKWPLGSLIMGPESSL